MLLAVGFLLDPGASTALVVKECKTGRVPWTLVPVPVHLHQYLSAIIITSASFCLIPTMCQVLC